MRKYIAFLLVFVMIFSLFGCKKTDETEKNSANLQEMLLFQAVTMAQQIGLSAEGKNMEALTVSPQIISLASSFRQAGSTYPAEAKIFPASNKITPAIILQMCAEIYGAPQVSASSALTIRTQIVLPKTLKDSVSVYLRYSDRCHFLVIFEPQENGIVSVWAYPLFANVVNKVLNIHTTKAEEWAGPQIEESCKAAADSNYNAGYTAVTPNAAHYSALATSLFADYKKISGKQISGMTDQKEVIAKALAISESLANGIQEVAVYDHPASMQSQVDEVLAQLTKPALAQAMTERLYLAVPNQMAATHGADWLTVSSILSTLIPAQTLGASAVKEEAPVYVLLGLHGSYSIVVSIYPNEHNIYTYSFAFLPLTFADAQAQMEASGAVMKQ